MKNIRLLAGHASIKVNNPDNQVYTPSVTYMQGHDRSYRRNMVWMVFKYGLYGKNGEKQDLSETFYMFR
jgi:hypothetical protein